MPLDRTAWNLVQLPGSCRPPIRTFYRRAPAMNGDVARGIGEMLIATACDPIYATTPDELARLALAEVDRGNGYVRAHLEGFVWTFFADPDEHRSCWASWTETGYALTPLRSVTSSTAAPGTCWFALAADRRPESTRIRSPACVRSAPRLSPLPHRSPCLAAPRVQLADTVAAAKWGTDAPINDPVREQAVLDAVAAKSRQLGIDPVIARAVFADQIEANKAVQYGLYAQWRRHPGQAPTTRPDLGQVRPIVDRITDQLLADLTATRQLRAEPSCADQLTGTRHRVEHARHLDQLHADALARALTAICR
jgi:chorismate mutase